jgi:predicted alpha/beta-fold hydrolase
MASGAALERGVCRWIYTPMFLQTMRHKALAKHRQFPGLFDLQRAQRATTLRAFDDAFTAPVHGFAGVDDYWTRASAKPLMHQIVLPALALNASDDPFVPVNSLPTVGEAGPRVVLVRTHHGGHVGYPSWDGGWRGHVRWMPEAVCDWLAPHATSELAHG